MNRQSTYFFLLLILVLMIGFPFKPSSAENQDVSFKDINSDETATAADAANMLRGLTFGRLSMTTNADLDFTKNGEIDGIDVRAVLYYACGGISSWYAFGERVSSGLCDERLFDHFSYSGTVDRGDGNYKSKNVSVTIYYGRVDNSDYQLADIYVQDIDCLVNAFGRGKYYTGPDLMQRMFDVTAGAIVAINGDYYSVHHYGPLIRDGVSYIEKIDKNWDIAVLLNDGVFLTYEYRTLTKEELSRLNVYQTWVFGPSLLDADGHAKTMFRSGVMPKNPRTVLGYYEPGHYAFLTVDGRSHESRGMTIEELSRLSEQLGFLRAYNLDGGQSSVMMSRSGPINNPSEGGRPISDIFVVREIP